MTIPVAVKLSPFFSNFANMAKRLDEAGADGLVLFNRFYQPDIDLESLEVKPNILFSTPMAMRVPLRWIAILYDRIRARHGGHQRCSSRLRRSEDADGRRGCDHALLGLDSPRHPTDQCDRARSACWMDEHEYVSVQQLRGSLSQKNSSDPSAFERAQYMRAISGYPVKH